MSRRRHLPSPLRRARRRCSTSGRTRSNALAAGAAWSGPAAATRAATAGRTPAVAEHAEHGMTGESRGDAALSLVAANSSSSGSTLTCPSARECSSVELRLRLETLFEPVVSVRLVVERGYLGVPR